MKKLVCVLIAVLCMTSAPVFGQSSSSVTQLQKVLKTHGARWEAGETSMTKLSPQEQKRRLGALEPDAALLAQKARATGTVPVPSVSLGPTLDWRNNGGNWVTPIRDQGGCGSCWAFASTAAAESANLRARQTPDVNLDLAEQVLLSCSNAGNCEQGGSITTAAQFIKTTGLPEEGCYPYTATDGSCSTACAGWQNSAVKISDWVSLGYSGITVDTLKQGLYTYGPLVVTMAVPSDFFSYSSGVYHWVSGDIAGYHAILLIGYDDTNQCFIVKNSWGTGWGESGFFRIAYSELTGKTGFGAYPLGYIAHSNCTYTVTLNQTGNYPGSGATGSANIATDNSCSWSVTSVPSFMTTTSATHGTGNGTVTFTLTDNNTGAVRSEALTIGGQTVTVSQSPKTTCTYSLTTTQQSLAAAGGTGTVGVTAAQGCAWTATSNAGWITITSGASGSGNGTVYYTASANTGAGRTGTVTIAGQTFTVTQMAGSCSYSLSPTSNSFDQAGGLGMLSVSTSSGCAWTAVSNNPDWIIVTSSPAGNGPGRMAYSVAENTGINRSGSMTVAGQTFAITQTGNGNCTYSISPSSGTVPATGGTGGVMVTTSVNCSWSASSNAPWLTITSGANGSGSGIVYYYASANTTGIGRTGTLTIADQTFRVTQQAQSCTYSINPSSQNFAAAGGSGSVGVTAGSGCAWSATSNAGWLTIITGASGSGNGTVSFSASANTGSTARTGTLTIAGQTFTATQAGQSCTYSISPSSQNFTSAGGSASVNVTSGSGCAWTATSNAGWTTITSGASGSGNGTVYYTASANTGTSRSGTMTIAGQTFSVTQDGGSCSITLSPTSNSFEQQGGSGMVGVYASAGCAWTGTSNNPDWIVITSYAGGTGFGRFTYSVAPNNGGPRSGSMTIGGQTFAVAQSGNSSCTYGIYPYSANVSAAGGAGYVNVNATDGCAWMATSNAGWITVTSGASGSGTGRATYSVQANTASARSGIVAIAGQSYVVSQAGQSCTYSISPSSQNFTSAGGSGSVNVTSGSGCAWTATSNAGWITVTSGASGSGNGTVYYAAGATTGASRTGTLTIAGQTFTVTQDGGSCSITLSPTSNSFEQQGGSGMVGVYASAGCAWTGTSNNPDWIVITSYASGTGFGRFTYYVAPNDGLTRSGSIRVGGQTLSVTQSGRTEDTRRR